MGKGTQDCYNIDYLLEIPDAACAFLRMNNLQGCSVKCKDTHSTIIENMGDGGKVLVGSRAYFIGNRMVDIPLLRGQVDVPSTDVLRFRPQIMSVIASPRFYGNERYSGVLVKIPNTKSVSGQSMGIQYYFGLSRVIFEWSYPTGQPDVYLLVEWFERHDENLGYNSPHPKMTELRSGPR